LTDNEERVYLRRERERERESERERERESKRFASVEALFGAEINFM